MRSIIVRTTGAMLLTMGASSCAALDPSFRPEPSGAVSGYRCPPLVTYTDEPARAAEQVEPGSAADRLLSDYYLMREMCR